MSGLDPLKKEKNITFESSINPDGKVPGDPIRISQV